MSSFYAVPSGWWQTHSHGRSLRPIQTGCVELSEVGYFDSVCKSIII